MKIESVVSGVELFKYLAYDVLSKTSKFIHLIQAKLPHLKPDGDMK